MEPSARELPRQRYMYSSSSCSSTRPGRGIHPLFRSTGPPLVQRFAAGRERVARVREVGKAVLSAISAGAHNWGAARISSELAQYRLMSHYLARNLFFEILTMGWLKWNSNLWPQTSRVHDLSERPECREALKADSIHTERIDDVSSNGLPGNKRPYIFHPTSLSDDRLPFIPSDIVRSAKTASDRLWIVIDNIVYDCTDFVHTHPGGSTVIQSFKGEDCSWQFWRFHNRSNMEMDGRPLRIGRTAGVTNRFKEKPRFLGLRRLGADEF